MKREIGFLIKALTIFLLLASISAPIALAQDSDGGELEETAVIPGWQQVNTSGFGFPENRGMTALESFKGYLYAGASNWDHGGSVWRTWDGLSWEPVSELGFGEAYTNTNPAVIDLFKFKNQLYVGLGWNQAPGQIWRAPDGITWEQVVGDGFGDPNNNGVTAFFMFRNMLYAAAGNEVTGVQIWRSPTGNTISWSSVITDGFGTNTNRTVTGFVKFRGRLYAATESAIGIGPTQVWRTKDGLHWFPVTTDGFGDPNNYSAGGFKSFRSYLYLGVRNDTTGGQIWRSKNGVTWNQVVGNGFGDSNNLKIESLFTYKSRLYAVTYNEVTGTEVWWSRNGMTWQQVNVDGFGNLNNFSTLWTNATAVFKSRLYIGTWNNVDGGEIWKMVPGKGK